MHGLSLEALTGGAFVASWDSQDTLDDSTGVAYRVLRTEIDGTAGHDFCLVQSFLKLCAEENGNDVLDGGANADTLLGGAGNDTLIFDHHDLTHVGAVDGGSGWDTLALFDDSSELNLAGSLRARCKTSNASIFTPQ